MYQEEEFLQLSGIQHFAFCKRQWALAYIEMQWTENVRTIEGRLLHERVHDETIMEKRGDLIISRAMPVYSRELGISGECDVVEFRQAETGIQLNGRDGLYSVLPIEYKRGKPKEDEVDKLQLAAQAMCLEDMLCCEISTGCLYYGETRHRTVVPLTDELRAKVRELFMEMHRYFECAYTPKIRRTKSCNACSLKDLCLPVLEKTVSVKNYIKQAVEDMGE